MTKILSGKTVADAMKSEVLSQVNSYLQENAPAPKLVVITVGDDKASAVYVRGKSQDAKFCNIDFEHITLPDDVGMSTLLSTIKQLNADVTVHGIIVQLPLPKGYDEREIAETINTMKDVDCFHPLNIGLLHLGINKIEQSPLPCTPAGIIELLDYYNVPISGKRAVVIGRSNIVGRPMAEMLLARDATVTTAHSKTPNLKLLTSEADILVSAIGVPKFITPDMIGQDSYIIDVGMNVDEGGNLCGDCDFDAIISDNRASGITPVPGGVGLLTRAQLMKNVLSAYEKQTSIFN